MLLLIYMASGIFTSSEGSDLNSAGEFLFVIWTLFWFFLWNGYFIVMELGPRGATFGKRAVGIRVAARDGGRLTAEAVLDVPRHDAGGPIAKGFGKRDGHFVPGGTTTIVLARRVTRRDVSGRDHARTAGDMGGV